MKIADCATDHARSWLGTPYVHQASTKGAGTDCLGLIRGVWRALYGDEPEDIPRYTRDWSEPSGQEALLDAADRLLIRKPLASSNDGDVLIFRMRTGAVAKHMGISASKGGIATFIHAYTGHGVVETPLSAPWTKRLSARFEFPEGV